MYLCVSALKGTEMTEELQHHYQHAQYFSLLDNFAEMTKHYAGNDMCRKSFRKSNVQKVVVQMCLTVVQTQAGKRFRFSA